MEEHSTEKAHHKPSHKPWVTRMVSRRRDEAHRASTPLELLLDLCFVVAIAQVAARLHHGIAEDHIGASLFAFTLVFYAIWWAWMNFTWFASAYDTDDVPYRLKTLVQIAGVLTIAAGVPRAFDRQDFSVVTIGYVIMRVGLVALWLRAAKADSARRKTALRYATGIIVCQIGWVALLFIPHNLWIFGGLALLPAELLTPYWAERAGQTTWHPHHIAERFGLLVLIVIGESVLSATTAIQSVIDVGTPSLHVFGLIIGGLLILFSMWWIYFDLPVPELLESNQHIFLWGYGHLFVFGSAAAVGAGLSVAVDLSSGHGLVPSSVGGAAVAIPVAIYVFCVWWLMARFLRKSTISNAAYLGAVALILAVSTLYDAVFLVGVILAVLVAITVMQTNRMSHTHH